MLEKNAKPQTERMKNAIPRSFAAPRLILFIALIPRLAPWATLYRHSVAEKLLKFLYVSLSTCNLLFLVAIKRQKFNIAAVYG